MIIKLYGDKAKQLIKELDLETRNTWVLRGITPVFKLTSVEGRDIVDIDIA